MNWKRSFLAILTAICVYGLVFALNQSFQEAQVQSQLELYQTDLILYSADLNQSLKSSQKKSNLAEISTNLVGANPYETAQIQYEKILNLTANQDNSNSVENSAIAQDSPRQKIKKEIENKDKLVKDLNLKLGILSAYQGKDKSALTFWENLDKPELKQLLKLIWIDEVNINEKQKEIINKDLNGWFKNATLAKLYTVENNQVELENINNQRQNLAEKAITRLIFLSIIPVVGGLIGFGLILVLIVQLLWKQETAILTTNGEKSWESPWNWETIIQVLIVGFFFISQIALPIIFSIVGFNPTGFDIRGKALYVLVTYLVMAGGGLSVLYLSIKSFFPLPSDWFKFQGKNWYWWGIGGYLVAIPLVFFVSLLNQQLWQGKGGSNPLLLLALESQDTIALLIFFVTASIAAPIFEEIMFRGFLLPSLTRYLPVNGAIILSAIIFAIAHLSIAETIPLATLGIILGIVYTRSRSLLASITLHSLWNSGTLLSLFLLGSKLT